MRKEQLALYPHPCHDVTAHRNAGVLTAEGAAFVREIGAVVVAVAEPRVPDTSVACRTFALTSRTPRDRCIIHMQRVVYVTRLY